MPSTRSYRPAPVCRRWSAPSPAGSRRHHRHAARLQDECAPPPCHGGRGRSYPKFQLERFGADDAITVKYLKSNYTCQNVKQTPHSSNRFSPILNSNSRSGKTSFKRASQNFFNFLANNIANRYSSSERSTLKDFPLHLPILKKIDLLKSYLQILQTHALT